MPCHAQRKSRFSSPNPYTETCTATSVARLALLTQLPTLPSTFTNFPKPVTPALLKTSRALVASSHPNGKKINPTSRSAAPTHAPPAMDIAMIEFVTAWLMSSLTSRITLIRAKTNIAQSVRLTTQIFPRSRPSNTCHGSC